MSKPKNPLDEPTLNHATEADTLGATGPEDSTIGGLTAQELGIPTEDTVEEITASEALGAGRPADKTQILNVGAPATSEATMITGNPLNRGAQAVRGRLTVVAGKETGRVIDLTDGTKTAGRGRDCDIILLDIQVSRQHVEIVTSAGGVLLRDLGSGNGTQLNGADVHEAWLEAGDEVALGDHVLRFEPVATGRQAALPVQRRGAAAAPLAVAPLTPPGLPSVAARRAAARRKSGSKGGKLMAFAAVGGLIVAGVFGAKVYLTPPPPVVDAGPSDAEVAQLLFSEGLAAFKAERYDEALTKLAEATAKAPQNEQIAKYHAAAGVEVGAQAALKRGADALAAKDYAGAREAYGSVDPESLSQAVATKQLAEVDRAEAAAIVAEADALVEKDGVTIADCEAAVAEYERALTVVADFEAATAGKLRAEAKKEDLERIARERAQGIKETAQQEEARKRREAREARERALKGCGKIFDAGKYHDALACLSDLASKDGDPELRRQASARAKTLHKFAAAYDRGMGALAARDAEGAIKFLSIAEPGAKAVSPKGPVHGRILQGLADMHYLQGRVAFNGQKYPAAFRHWDAAVRYVPGHKYCQDGLKDLEKHANEVYIAAYIQWREGLNRSEALRDFRAVMTMTRPGSELHKKAKQRLEESGETP